MGSDNDEDGEERQIEPEEDGGQTIQEMEKVENGVGELPADTTNNEKRKENLDGDSEETQT